MDNGLVCRLSPLGAKGVQRSQQGGINLRRLYTYRQQQLKDIFLLQAVIVLDDLID
jgi:hypothetical protein